MGPSASMRFFLVIFVVSGWIRGVPAPVPRCSPFIFINKGPESSNLLSDANPYFPVPPCEYGGPLQALRAGDYEAVFILAHPEKVPLHNFYELVWFLKTGLPRWMRILSGRQKLEFDPKILSEGYSHYTPYVRTRQIGFQDHRRPGIIDNFDLFRRVVGGQIRTLMTRGGDPVDLHAAPPGLPLNRNG